MKIEPSKRGQSVTNLADLSFEQGCQRTDRLYKSSEKAQLWTILANTFLP